MQVSSNIPTASPTQTANGASGFNDQFNTFLTLLTTQLQYQDPLSPLDTAEFTNQLVLYTQAEQQIRTNSNLDKLVALQQGSIGTQALGYIGKDIGFSGRSLYSDGTPVDQTIAYNLPRDASDIDISIKDAAGVTVRRIEGATNAGVSEVVWDGKTDNGEFAGEGVYDISITARDPEGNVISGITTLVNARVTGIESDGSGSVNLVISGERRVPLSSIASVSIPQSSAT